MESNSIVSLEFEYGFIDSVKRAIGAAVESMKDGAYIKRLCVLDARLTEEVERLEKLEQVSKKKELEEKLRDVECELKRLS